MSDVRRWLALAGDPQMTPASRGMFRDMAMAALEKRAPKPLPGQAGFGERLLSSPQKGPAR